MEKVTKDQQTFDIELDEDQVGRWPEFRRRRNIRMSFDHKLAERNAEVVPIDLESTFMRHLVAMAQDRDAFDGVYGEAAKIKGWEDGDILTTHQVRWQSLSGDILEEDLIPVRMTGAAVKEMPRDVFAELLLSPFETIGAEGDKNDRVPVLTSEFSKILAKKADGERMPSAVTTFTALRWS